VHLIRGADQAWIDEQSQYKLLLIYIGAQHMASDALFMCLLNLEAVLVVLFMAVQEPDEWAIVVEKVRSHDAVQSEGV
jgi:hypothetical protein